MGTASNFNFDDNGRIVIAFSLSNPGNQTIVVADASVMALQLAGNLTMIHNQAFSPHLPIVLEAGDVQFFSVAGDFTPKDFYIDADRANANCQQGTRSIEIVIDIMFVDSKGNNRASRMPISEVCLDQYGIDTFAQDLNPKDLVSEKYKIPFFLKNIMVTPTMSPP